MKNIELINTVQGLIQAGCHYDIHELEKIYCQTLFIIILDEDGTTTSFNYTQNLDFFRSLKQNKAPPLDTTAVFNYADIKNDIGYVIVTRNLDLGHGLKKIVFNLMLRQTDNKKWQVFREHAVVIGNA
ncbi:MAG: hypothetical protein GAK29_02639 [Acinetobacter bereziniae]|uniref:Nuclear transport factor 2 family protein n=1 Tax=Acinetobacter bereziniae TaxID=106648 RepID=A0A833PEP6_ACIBZ|nr:MAG: hypothetical protein GAK29_02639 [Acinetobacter bereziniae]